MTRTVLITGSSSGIGREAVRAFSSAGWNVAATMRSPEKETEFINKANILCVRLDVTETATIKSAVREIIKHFGSLDVLVNNAGYAVVGPLEAIGAEVIKRQFETNVFGLVELTREVLPHFRKQRSGTIIQVASMGGRITFPLYSLYHGTKWAVEGFSESLQHEVRPFNIRVRIVEPGPIKTDFYDRSMDIQKLETLRDYDAYVDKAMKNMNAFGDDGTPPSVVAETILKAAQDRSWKLRYPVGTKGILVLRRLLPDRLFNSIIRKTLKL